MDISPLTPDQACHVSTYPKSHLKLLQTTALTHPWPWPCWGQLEAISPERQVVLPSRLLLGHPKPRTHTEVVLHARLLWAPSLLE